MSARKLTAIERRIVRRLEAYHQIAKEKPGSRDEFGGGYDDGYCDAILAISSGRAGAPEKLKAEIEATR